MKTNKMKRKGVTTISAKCSLMRTFLKTCLGLIGGVPWFSPMADSILVWEMADHWHSGVTDLMTENH